MAPDRCNSQDILGRIGSKPQTIEPYMNQTSSDTEIDRKSLRNMPLMNTKASRP